MAGGNAAGSADVEPEDIVPLILIGGIVVGIPLWGIFDAARVPSRSWKSAGHSKAGFIILQVIAGLVGTISYVMIARPKIMEPESADG